MKTLLLKSAILLAPFVAMSMPTLARTAVTVARVERSVTLRDGVFNDVFEGKYLAFVREDVNAIVAGDSRAERQVAPAVVEACAGWKTVNIGTNGGDLVTLHNAVRRHGLPPAVRVLLISTSVFQVNDGAIDPGYVSTACFLNMTGWERLAVYADRLGSPWAPLEFTLTERPPVPPTGPRFRELGFLGVQGRLSLPLPKMLLENHPWYRKLSLRGARWRIFRETLERLAQSDRQIYLFQPPISPAWRAYTEGTFVDKGEREYIAMLTGAAAAHRNVRFLDFYSEADPRLGNDQYYDIQHLNRHGAEVFTRILCDRVVHDLRARGTWPSPKAPGT